MVTAAIKALGFEYLNKILDWGWSRSRYIFTGFDSTENIFPLRLHDSDSTALLCGGGVSIELNAE
jgi:hypothetical protein